MARVKSLGLHEPSALPYLIAENIFPQDPPRHLYRWQTDVVWDEKTKKNVEEELLVTDSCVVWSVSRVVQRVYNLNVEGESILQAFTTSFVTRAKRPSFTKDGALGEEYNTTTPILRHERLAKARRTTHSTNPNKGKDYSARGPPSAEEVERALVVVLKTQAHLFLLTGSSHVLPLSFEVRTAFAGPRGFFLQRKPDEGESDSMFPRKAQPSRSKAVPNSNSLRPSLVLPETDEIQWMYNKRPKGIVPSTFYVTDILSEMGVVTASSDFSIESSLDTGDEAQFLGADESLIYVTGKVDKEGGDTPFRGPYLAVTCNTKSQTFTFWQVLYEVDDSCENDSGKMTSEEKEHLFRRKSSNVYGTLNRAATPIAHGPHARESFGALAQSYSENLADAENLDSKVSQLEDLETQLGAGFGTSGVQTRSARRVSSMLARTDLTLGHERNILNELVSGKTGRKSMNRSTHRGESIGSFGDGLTFGARRRSSFPGYASVTSNGTSFLGASFYHPVDELPIPNDNGFTESPHVNTDFANLPRDVRFEKIRSISCSANSRIVHNQDHHVTVFLLSAPNRGVPGASQSVSLCVMNKGLKELTVINFTIRPVQRKRSDRRTQDARFRVKMKDVRRGSNIVDACKVYDKEVGRILILTKTRDGGNMLQLEAPWSAPFRIELPLKYVIFDPFTSPSFSSSPDRRRETGLSRVIQSAHINVAGLQTIGVHGQFAIEDTERKLHRVQVQLQSHDHAVSYLLDVCDFSLPASTKDGLRVAWWEVRRWLKTREDASDLDWTAMIVVLFALAIPFLNGKGSQNVLAPRRKKDNIRRSSSGTGMDLSNWDTMLELEATDPDAASRAFAGWDWAGPKIITEPHGLPPVSPTQSKRMTSMVDNESEKKITKIIKLVSLAREFLQTPAGESAIGPEGYLPTAMNQERGLRSTAVAAVLVGLQLAREEGKLNSLNSCRTSKEHDLAPVLAQLGHWLGWKAWTWKGGTYYSAEIGDTSQWLFDDSVITELEMPGQPFEPPAIFTFIEQSVLGSAPTSFPTLLDVAGHPGMDSSEDILQQVAAKLTPRSFVLLSFLSSMTRLQGDKPLFKSIIDCGIDHHFIQSTPDGIAAVFHKVVTGLRSTATTSGKPLLKLLGRDVDIVSAKGTRVPVSTRFQPNLSHDAIRDNHSIASIAFETETLHTFDTTSEADRHTITRLIFQHDRRFQEASKLVNQTRPPLVDCTPEPEWTEADLLDAQKELAQHVTRRTLSVASGRGMMHFNARVPLLTERVPIPAFSLQCVMKPRHGSESSQAITFSADKAAFTEDKVCWAFFHNGASAGLMISREAKGIDTSWILYNKPPELTNRHAGFLLALGLNGHLKNLAKWVAFKYLTPKHTMTSIGLLLGLAASYLGTMDTLITRLLSVHVTRLLPPGAAELNLSGLTQTSGIMSVGLVYLGSGHRRMSEVMISEIENTEIEEPGGGGAVPSHPAGEEKILRDEGYRLAAGLSLGFINLGKGKQLHGLRDMNVLERLLSVAVGTKNVDFVNVLDRATAGAVIAVALVWMKTNDASVARKIDVPDTVQRFEYVRPDIFLLRTLARHLIMWDEIQATQDFVEKSLPSIYRRRASLKTTKWLSSEDMPFFNIIAGICFSIGLRFSGSLNSGVRDLLVAYLDQFIRLTRLPALNYDAKLTRNSVRNCQDVVALSAAAVMAGSGDLVVLRRLRSLHGRTDGETPFGSHMAAHMAIGALFLGGGTCTFGTSNVAVASLVVAFYPVFPTGVLDNQAHLQALRHMWVLAIEERCVVGREVGSGRATSVEMCVKMKDKGQKKTMQTPGLLPGFEEIESVEVKSTDYWEVSLDFTNDDVKSKFKRDQNVWLRRRAAYERPVCEVFVAELQALDEASDLPGIGERISSRGVAVKSPFEWLFELDSFKNLDQAERALIFPPITNGEELLKGSVVDTRLELEKGILGGDVGKPMDRDQLWQLRLLFAWVDRWDREEEETKMRGEEPDKAETGSVTWLRREVIDRLRWRVWKMAGGGSDDNDDNE